YLLDSGSYQTYNRDVARALGSVNAAILLSELINRHRYHAENEELVDCPKNGAGWFYYTVEKCEERTCLSKDEQRFAFKILERNGFFEMVRIGIPGKRHFRLNTPAIISFITSNKVYSCGKTRQLESEKKITDVGNPHQYMSGFHSNTCVENRHLSYNKEPHVRTPCKKSSCCDSQAAQRVDEERPKDPSIDKAELLARKIKANNPKAHVPESLSTWARDIERMHRIDGYSYDEIEALIEYSQQDAFWSSNVLSAQKLRKQAGALTMRMKGEKAQKSKPSTKKSEPVSGFREPTP